MILTASDRLARELRADHSLAQLRAGRRVWESAAIQSLRQWTLDAWTAGWPAEQLLHPLQELALWRSAIESDAAGRDLLSVAAAARAARAADQLAIHHAIDVAAAPAFTAEQQAFQRWHRAVHRRRRAEGWITAAELAGAVAARVREGTLPAPERIELRGFLDPPVPGDRALLDALGGRGSRIAEPEPVAPASNIRRLRFADSDAQLRHVAQSLQDILAGALEASSPPRVLVLCADPERIRDGFEAMLRATLAPWRNLPGGGPVPWRWGEGRPLAERPLVAVALALAGLRQRGNPVERVSQLLLAPALWSEPERAAAAALDYALRRQGHPRVRLDALIPPVESLAARWQALCASVAQAPRQALPSGWAAQFEARLDAVGWPGTAALDSTQHQIVEEWRRTLAQFGAMDRQLERIGQGDAVSWLGELLALRRLEPRAEHEEPVLILRHDEGAGLPCEHLFVLDATADVLPRPARHTPFLARESQRRAGVVAADPAAQLEQAQRLAAHLTTLAPQVTLCAPDVDALGTACLPTTLFGDGAWERPAAIALLDAAERAAAASAPEWPAVDSPPAFTAEETAAVRGGVRILRDFAEAPFFAFCRHRLGIERFPQPARGLDGRVQGLIVHDSLELLWQGLQDSAGLAASDSAALQARIEAAVAACLPRHMPEAEFGRALQQLERARVHDVLRQWLAHERRRVDAFRVHALERKLETRVGGLALRLRIDRVDEVTSAHGQRFLVIDYKTGDVSAAGWDAEALREPQLPLYACAGALAAAEVSRVDGVCFAQVQDGHPALVALTNWCLKLIEPETRADAQAYERSWQGKLGAWRVRLEDLAARFLAGDAGLPGDAARSTINGDLLALVRNAP